MSKVILVTGATSGIGKATASYFHQKGYVVYGTGRHPQKDISEEGFNLLRMDLTIEEDIRQAVEKIFSKEHRIDILINNAGIGIIGATEEIPGYEMRKVMETNFFGPVTLIQTIMPYMREQKKGLIINITSIAGYIGLPFRGVYSSSKGALELMTEALRMEVKPFGIEVTNLAPGDFSTDIASRRYHVPHDSSNYGKIYTDIHMLINHQVSSSNSPIGLAKKINEIVNKESPKIHYKFGSFLQKFSIILKRILPDTLFEKLIMNHYKM